jgi:hypothetical protein
VDSVPTITSFTFTLAGTLTSPATGTITLRQPWDGNADAFGYPVLDQIGRGAGDYLGGADLAALPPGNNGAHQISDSAYAWGNTLNGSPALMFTQAPNTDVENRDFFNCTVGVVTANCVAGQYPKSGYTPFTYPHPLVSGQVIIPSPVRSVILSWVDPGGGDGFTIQRKDGHCLVPGTFADLIHVTASTYIDSESPFPYACYHARATLSGAPDSLDSNDDGSYLPLKTAPLRGLRRR